MALAVSIHSRINLVMSESGCGLAINEINHHYDLVFLIVVRSRGCVARCDPTRAIMIEKG
jgi:hypothetical protein